jgi:hypothetical protein
MMQKFRMCDGFKRRVDSRLDGRLAQELREAGECATAVAHAVLRGRGRLGEGLPELRGEEEGIVAEAAFTALGREDRPLGDAVGLEDDAVAVGESRSRSGSGRCGGGATPRAPRSFCRLSASVASAPA